MRRVLYGMVIVVLVGLGVAVGATRKVHCDVPGQTITKALKTAQPGDTIQVSGTCAETVTITTDRLTLEGIDTATINGPGGGSAVDDISTGLVNIVGAQGIIITGFTVQNSDVDGINGRQGAAVTLSDVEVLDSADDGIEITESSTVRLTDVTVLRSGEHGIRILRGSNGVSDGMIVSNDNGTLGVRGSGILVATTSNITFRTGNVEASGNGLDGLQLVSSGNVQFNRTMETITTHNNERDGMVVFNSGAIGAFGGTFSASGNGRDGVRSGENAAFSSFPPATFSLTNNTGNGIGVFAARVLIIPPALIEGNSGAGVFATDGGSTTMFNATIQNNGPPDVNLVVGSRANLVVTNPGTIVVNCDAASLVFGNTGVLCPNP